MGINSVRTSFHIFSTTTDYLQHLKRVYALYDVRDLFTGQDDASYDVTVSRISNYLHELDHTFSSHMFPKHHFVPRFMVMGYRVPALSDVSFKTLHSALYYWLKQLRLYAPYYTLNPVQYIHAVDPLTHDRIVYVYAVNMNYLWYHTSFEQHNAFMMRALRDASLVYQSVTNQVRPPVL